MSPIVGQIPGIPGGPELLLLLIMAVMMFAIPVLVIVAALKLVGVGSNEQDKQRIDELEQEVEELREQNGD